MIRGSTSRDWAELCALFDALVELDSAARAERLAAIGLSDPTARDALEALLDADANADSGLNRLDVLFGIKEEPLSERSENADEDVLNLVGKTIAHFRVVGPLAAGGMGVVYRAVDTQLGRTVALKFPRPGRHLDRDGRERFLHEARAAGALDHPNLCSIYEAGETEDGQLYLAMPLYDGETLKTRITRAGPLPIADTIDFALQIARGLHAAHRAGIVHRDLKPANVMILFGGGVKILDFGIARSSDVTLTAGQSRVGTVPYMAPEQVRGEQIDARTDIWALGVLMYEMLTGRRPFAGEHEITIAHAILHSDPVRPSMFRPEIWLELDDVVLGLLAKQRDTRPSSADAVISRLTALKPPAAPHPVPRWRSVLTRSPKRALGVASVALVLVAIGTAGRMLRTESSAEPRTLAVLPFQNSGSNKDYDYLAVGLSDEIASQLSRLRSVAMPGDQSAREYRGTLESSSNIAKKLGTSALVRGSVRRSAGEVRLDVELFDAIRNRQVWTHEYHGPANTLGALQRSATADLARALKIGVTRDERAGMLNASTLNAEAFDLYLHGRAAQSASAWNDVGDFQPATLDSLQRAQSYFARAREIDPEFAAARAHLAMSQIVLGQYDKMGAWGDQGRLEAEAALRLQPGIPEAHEALASYWISRDDLPRAITQLEQAILTRPNASHLYGLLGSSLLGIGRWDEGLKALERASRIDPHNKPVHYRAAMFYSRMRKYPEAIKHWDQVIALDSATDPIPQVIRAFVYLRLGEVDSLDAAISRLPLTHDVGGLTTYGRYIADRIKRRYPEFLASLDSSTVTVFSDGAILYLPASLMRGQTLEQMGDSVKARANYEAAREFLEDSVAAHPRDGGMRVALGLAYAGLHRRADAIREAKTATEIVPMSQNSTFSTALMGGALEIYARLGESNAAFDMIELLLSMPAGRELSPQLLRVDPVFDKLRSDPRYDALINRFSNN
jgi:serine/threonine protein kinase/tetratricopeptide (TPR) repeat protein